MFRPDLGREGSLVSVCRVLRKSSLVKDFDFVRILLEALVAIRIDDDLCV